MSIIKKVQSRSVGEMDPHPNQSKANRLSLDGGEVVDPNSLEKHRDSLESGIGSLSTITSYLTPDSADEALFHQAGPSSEPQIELNVFPNNYRAASMSRSNDFRGNDGPKEAETGRPTWYNGPENHTSFDDSLVQHRGSERSPSNFSELSLVGTEGSYSGRSSIDSAICMDNPVTRRTRRASVATNRLSMYSVISSDTIYEMPESPSGIEEGNPQVTEENADDVVSNLQFKFSSRLQVNEEAPEECNNTTDNPKTSRIVKLIRFILRVANTCIRTPQVRSENELDYEPAGDHKLHATILGQNKHNYAISGVYENVAFTEDGEAKANFESELADENTVPLRKATDQTHTVPTSKEISGNINSHRNKLSQEGVDCSSAELTTNVNERKTDNKQPTFHEFTLEKKYFLESFEGMVEQAKSRGIDVIGHNFQIANCAAAILDCRGGCLSIDDLDVHLYVPPDAIAVGKEQQVYIFVTGASSVDNHYFSTPFVHCGPPDTTFEEDVVLTMPHCVKDTSSCKFALSKLSSGSSSELSEGLDVITVVDNDSITFSVNHFCGFGATASPVLDKFMIACVFIREDSHSDEVTLRLQLVDDVKVNLLEVKEKQRGYGFHLADIETPLIVWKNDQDMVIQISTSIESWEITEPESCQRKIHRKLLWRETAASCAQAFPSVTFFAKRRSDSEKVCFKARMTVYQGSSKSCNYGVDFLVKANKRVCPTCVLDKEQQMKEKTESFLKQIQNDGNSVTESRLLKQPIFGELCDLLDAPNPLGNDWRKLLSLLLNTGNGCSENIDSIEEKAGRERRSPTKIVLDLFFGKQSGRKKEETMKTLKCALSDINRPDAKFAIDAIDEGLNKLLETRKGPFISTPHIPIIKVTEDDAYIDADEKFPKNTRKDSAYNSGVRKECEEALKAKLERGENLVINQDKETEFEAEQRQIDNSGI